MVIMIILIILKILSWDFHVAQGKSINNVVVNNKNNKKLDFNNFTKWFRLIIFTRKNKNI